MVGRHGKILIDVTRKSLRTSGLENNLEDMRVRETAAQNKTIEKLEILAIEIWSVVDTPKKIEFYKNIFIFNLFETLTNRKKNDNSNKNIFDLSLDGDLLFSIKNHSLHNH